MRADERRSLPELAVAFLREQRLIRGAPLLDGVPLDLRGVRERQRIRSGEAGGRRPKGRDELAHALEPAERDRRGEPDELGVPERELC